MIRSFEDLEVYRQSLQLTREMFELTNVPAREGLFINPSDQTFIPINFFNHR